MTWGWVRVRDVAAAGAVAAVTFGCGSAPEVPAVVGEDLAFTRGAMAAAQIDYTVEEVEVTDSEHDGVVQAAEYDDETGQVVVEVGRLPMVTITGEFTLVADPLLETGREGQSCSGSGGYSDFGNGMNVTVRDGTGAIVASTNTSDAQWARVDGVGGLWCRTAFETTADIVDFYTITVGRRGELSYSFDELKDRDYHVELSLGG